MAKISALTIPTWGMSMTEGTIASWLATPGQTIEAGRELAEIETTKLTGVYEAHEGGLVLRRILAEAGETLPCGALIGVLAEEGVPDSEIDAFVATYTPAESDDGPAGGPVETAMVVGDTALNVLTAGSANGSALPVLFIHGFGGNVGNWGLSIAALSGERLAVAADLPGHGKSSKRAPNATPESFAATLARMMADLGIARYHVVGHSYGGLIAGILARACGTGVAGVVLVAPAGASAEGVSDYVSRFNQAADRRSLKSAMEMLVADKDLISRSMVAEVLDYRRIDGVQTVLEAIADDLTDRTGKYGGLPPDVGRRTMVIWGERDEILPAAHAQLFGPNAQVVIVPEIGHMPHIEWSDFNHTLSTFLKLHEG